MSVAAQRVLAVAGRGDFVTAGREALPECVGRREAPRAAPRGRVSDALAQRDAPRG